jgi:antitoxin ChpS
MTPEIRTALMSFAKQVASTYRDNLVTVVLFGSQARDDANEDSDVDVGVILKDISDRRSVRDRLSDLAYDVLLDSGVDIQAVALTKEQWAQPDAFTNPSLIRAMRRDGVTIGLR